MIDRTTFLAALVALPLVANTSLLAVCLPLRATNAHVQPRLALRISMCMAPSLVEEHDGLNNTIRPA